MKLSVLSLMTGSLFCNLININPSFANTISSSKVLSVIDGDTVSILTEGKKEIVDLACIRAPELTNVKNGVNSANSLMSLLPVDQEINAIISESKSNKKSVAFIYLKNRFVNAEMVRRGYAVPSIDLSLRCTSYENNLTVSQIYAKDNRLGLWNQINPSKAWDISKNTNANKLSSIASKTLVETLEIEAKQAEVSGKYQKAIDALEQLIYSQPQNAYKLAVRRNKLWSHLHKIKPAVNTAATTSITGSSRLGTSAINGNCNFTWQTDTLGRRCGKRASGYKTNYVPRYNSTYSPSYRPSYKPSSSSSGRTYVRGYTRKNGTRVRGYYRRK